ncbi:type IX secretion system outer membrane channel protein PorV [Nibrella saemangeumensis]|uniref:type IX secretion system outer membrane channel protein PorV n=1 Tax=Nibrella saemangeumensis TaxID=1084526 RepID=UPI0031ECFBD5
MKRIFSRCFIGAGCLLPLFVSAQVTTPSGQQLRVVNSAVPFLNFTPDARSGGLGEAGVALSPDANAIFWNPAKLVFAQENAGAAVSYTPWLRDLIGDMYYTYLTAYKKIGKNQVIGASLLYFDLGTIQFTTAQGLSAGSFNSREYAITANYSRQLFRNFSMGVNLRYLNSNLAGSYTVGGTPIKPGATAAVDISAYYHDHVRDEVSGKGIGWSYGAMLSNLGGRINYGSQDRYFIPTNLRLGGAFTYYADQVNKFNFVLDFNKLMVPTPPVYGTPVNGQAPPILRGKDPNRPYLSGIFGSFADAPDGFGEEVKEVTISTGVEYWYNDLFAARVGFYNEANDKGGRKYLTSGLGVRLQDRYGIDFSYLMPVKGNSPLANTFRLTLLINFNQGVGRVDEDSDE